MEHDVKEIAAQGIKCYKNQGKMEVIAGQAMTTGGSCLEHDGKETTVHGKFCAVRTRVDAVVYIAGWDATLFWLWKFLSQTNDQCVVRKML